MMPSPTVPIKANDCSPLPLPAHPLCAAYCNSNRLASSSRPYSESNSFPRLSITLIEALIDIAQLIYQSRFLSMATRKRTSAQRSAAKRRILEHQKDIDGKLPVHEMTLKTHFNDGALFPTQVYVAPLQPLVEGHKRHSQTAVVMRCLELFGAEYARL